MSTELVVKIFPEVTITLFVNAYIPDTNIVKNEIIPTINSFIFILFIDTHLPFLIII